MSNNVANYTIGQLMSILKLQTLNRNDIINSTNIYIKNPLSNSQVINFFRNAQLVLLTASEQQSRDNDNDDESDESEYDDDDDDDCINSNEFSHPSKDFLHLREGFTNQMSDAEQTNNWFNNEYPSQSNPIQTDKITERKQKIDVYDNDNVPMNRQQLGVSNNFQLPVAQDVLNPNLKNVTSRTIVLDSQYRQSGDSNTDYTLDLSDPLTNVLSLRLYSFAIPYTWYNITDSNNVLWITFNDAGTDVILTIMLTNGNYNNTTIVLYLNQAFADSDIVSTSTITSISPITGLLTFNLYGAVYNGEYTFDERTVILFFDPGYDGVSLCSSFSSSAKAINETLGWTLGFRTTYTLVKQSGNTSTAIPDLNGSKYFILVLDDLNKNHINNGLIGITELSKTIKLPSYYTSDFPTSCSLPIRKQDTNADQQIQGLDLIDKLNLSVLKTPQILPTAPRTLTQAKIYSINEILKNNQRYSSDYKLKCPVAGDTMAIIPIKLGSGSFGSLYSEFGGTMQDNKREYFGPTNISRIRIKLLDDKGNLVNLNNVDWTITLICESLYQY